MKPSIAANTASARTTMPTLSIATPYERLHAAMNIRTLAATISHPASDQGHTGALM